MRSRRSERRAVVWQLESGHDARPLRRDAVVVGLLALFAVAALLVRGPLGERAVIASLGIAALARFVMLARARARTAPPRESIRIDAQGVARVGKKGLALVEWDKPFGVTVLAQSDRERGLLVFTTPEQTRYVPFTFDERAPSQGAELLALSTPIADGDGAAAAETRGALTSTSALALLLEIERRSPGAARRFYLSGTHGEQVVLENTELRVGTRTFDLDAALEWRGFTFHESTGHTATLYQATWVRQGGAEAVLVSPLPPEMAQIAPPAEPTDAARRAHLREIRLQQATPGTPPAREARVGIERLFMLPLRRALDGAPRASRSGGMPKLRSGHTGGASSGA